MGSSSGPVTSRSTPAIRPATAADQAMIVSLVRATGINPLGLHWPHFLVAEVSGRVAGIGQVKLHRDGSRELASIAVVPEFRQQGVASQIIEALLAQETGPLYLTCRSNLQPFYERFGFHRVGRAAGLPSYFRLVFHLFGIAARVTLRPPRVIVMRRS